MRLGGLLLAAILAAPLGAASLGYSTPDGATRVVAVQAQRLDADALDAAIDAQYQAGYYYCLAQVAEQMDQPAAAAEALERAQSVDPDSSLLRNERAEQLEAAGQGAQAVVLWQAALDAAPQDLELRRRLARAYLRLGRIGEARALFLQKDGSDPVDPVWLRSLVAIDVVQGDLAGAQKRLEALLARQDDQDDRELLGLTLERRKRYAAAAAQFKRVLKLDPGRGEAWSHLAECHEASGDTVSAQADLRRGLAAAPEDASLQEDLAKLCYRNGDYAGAEAAFGALLKRQPQDGDLLMMRGMARLKDGHDAGAQDDFTALGRLRPGDPSQAYALALALIQQKKWGPAEDQLQKVVKEDPSAEPAWVQLALLQGRQGRTDESRQTLRRGLDAIPKSEDLALVLSASYEDAADYKGAEAVLRQAIQRAPTPGLRFQLAVILDKAGDFPKAQAQLLDLIASEPKDAEALNYLGYSWADRGVKLDQAEDLIRRAVAVEPDNPYYQDSLGWVLHKEKRDADALAPLLKASQSLGGSRDADEAVVFDHLARVQKDLGRAVEADQALEQARSIRERAQQAGAADGADKETEP